MKYGRQFHGLMTLLLLLLTLELNTAGTACSYHWALISVVSQIGIAHLGWGVRGVAGRGQNLRNSRRRVRCSHRMTGRSLDNSLG